MYINLYNMVTCYKTKILIRNSPSVPDAFLSAVGASDGPVQWHHGCERSFTGRLNGAGAKQMRRLVHTRTIVVDGGVGGLHAHERDARLSSGSAPRPGRESVKKIRASVPFAFGRRKTQRNLTKIYCNNNDDDDIMTTKRAHDIKHTYTLTNTYARTRSAITAIYVRRFLRTKKFKYVLF